MSEHLLDIMVGQIWQITILTVVTSWVTNTLLKKYPTLSHQLWLVVMVKCLVPPVWASECGVFSWCFHQITDATVWMVGSSSLMSKHSLAIMIGGVWLTGAVATLLRAFTSWKVVQRRILKTAVEVPPEFQRLATKLAFDLGIRRRIRFVVSDEPVGPAVIGLFRPWLVMPSQLLAGKSAKDIEPILAHELLHVQRGDTAVALLETAVRAVWWFHPSVQRAADELSHTGEICCDQDVLTKLTYSSRRYAESLIQVIEAKCELQPLVGQPGVRRDQVTRKRLERIMTWDRSRPRTVVRVLIYVVAVLVILPGRPI